MTKAQLIEAVARSAQLPKETVGSVLDLTFEQISRALRKDKRFWVPGFGTFSVRRHKARRGVNPRTNAPMIIPAMRTVGFRPAPKLKKVI
jgi:DNA-binding protein HU-beta